MTSASLHIKNLTLTVAGKVLFRDLTIDLPSAGIVGMMGPMGVGKSTLISWLSGKADPELVKATYDALLVGGEPITDLNRPHLLPQKAARTADEALALLDGILAQNPPMICVDEVTASLTPADTARVLEWLENTAHTVPIIMVSHNQLQVASHSVKVILLAAGRLQEMTATKQFFTAPTSQAGEQFIRTGSTNVVNPDSDPSHLTSEMRAVPTGLQLSTDSAKTDSSLQWIVKDQLAIFRPLNNKMVTEADLEAISNRGISSVIILDDDRPVDQDALSRLGLAPIWFPMAPDTPPGIAECQALSRECDRLLKSGEKIAVLRNSENVNAERTVAAQLVFMGLPAAIAAKIMRDAVAQNALGIKDEQLLWDLELSNDLGEIPVSMTGTGEVDMPHDSPYSNVNMVYYGQSAARGGVVSS